MKTFKVTYIEDWSIKYLRLHDDWSTIIHNVSYKINIEQVIKIEVIPEHEGV